MKVKVYVIDLPSWVRRVVLPAAAIAVAVLGWRIASASVPNTFADGAVLTAQSLNDNFKAVELPTGTIIPYAGDPAKVPPGYLLCDGAPVDRINYPALFTTIGTTWGAPDGSRFNLPDLRGRFLRGVSPAGGADPDCEARTSSNPGGATGCAVGTVQADQVQKHSHDYPAEGNTTTTGFAVPNNIKTDTTHQTGASGGNETRPKNAAVAYLIKI